MTNEAEIAAEIYEEDANRCRSIADGLAVLREIQSQKTTGSNQRRMELEAEAERCARELARIFATLSAVVLQREERGED